MLTVTATEGAVGWGKGVRMCPHHVLPIHKLSLRALIMLQNLSAVRSTLIKHFCIDVFFSDKRFCLCLNLCMVSNSSYCVVIIKVYGP